MDQTIRINKYLASLGLASRRQVDRFFSQGRITVNGKTAHLGDKIDPQEDTIKFDDSKIEPKIQQKIYIALNKPLMVLSTTKDSQGRTTVLDLVKLPTRLYPIGRLDYNTTGLILLTNDGDLTLKLTHPRYKLAKTYLAKIRGKITKLQLHRLKTGVQLEQGITLPSEVKIISQDQYTTVFEIILKQGINRQIRRMCQVLDLNLISLKRLAVGPIKLKTLPVGHWRYLTPTEIEQIKGQKT